MNYWVTLLLVWGTNGYSVPGSKILAYHNEAECNNKAVQIQKETSDDLQSCIFFTNRKFEALQKYGADLKFYDERKKLKAIEIRISKQKTTTFISKEKTGEFVLSKRMIAALIKQESGGKNGIISKAGAVGVMQIMPATARLFAVRAGHPKLKHISYKRLIHALKNPRINKDFGRTYLHYCYHRYKGDEVLTLICYNAGPRRGDYAEWTKKKSGKYAVPTETYHYIRSIWRMAGRKLPPVRKFI